MSPAGRLVPAGESAAWPRPLDADSLSKWAEVNVGVLRSNIESLVEFVAPTAAVMVMVKGNGYGHGAVLTARAAVAAGAAWLGVSAADEALQLRNAGINVPVLVVGWVPDAALPALVKAEVDLTVYTPTVVAATIAAAKAVARPARVHVKLDTGMGRLGVQPDELPELIESLRDAGRHLLVTGIFTHFASAGSDTEFTLHQNGLFSEHAKRFREVFPDAIAHAANSAALLSLPETHHDVVRPGIAIYGYPPSGTGGAIELRPALSVYARISHLKIVATGATVGYGREWMATRSTRVATVAVGYADGVFRAQGNHGVVLCAGQECAIIGRVSMDQIGVDVSHVEDVKVGDPVLLLGQDGEGTLSADTVAANANTISYEVLTAISARVPRFVIST